MNLNREAQRALSDLIGMIPEASRRHAEREIEIIYTALVLFEQYERTTKEIGTTLYHNSNERERLINRLTERKAELT